MTLSFLTPVSTKCGALKVSQNADFRLQAELTGEDEFIGELYQIVRAEYIHEINKLKE